MSHWDDRFLLLAQCISKWSRDPSTQVGAVVVDSNKRIVSVGYNGFPKGVRDDCERLNDRAKKLAMTVHAEVNAILFAQKDLEGCTLYVTPFMPCSNCAGIVIQSGIGRVVTLKNDVERWQESFNITRLMFEEANVTLEECA